MTHQRLRITYRRAAAAGDVQSGRLARAWIEAFECAQLPVARPEGSKRARLEVGPPLPQDAIGEAELVDVVLARPVPPDDVVARLYATLPEGMEPLRAEEIGERMPSLQASMRSARYRIAFDTGDVDGAALRERARRLLALPTLDWEEQRGERLRRFDLRALIHDLEVCEEPGAVTIHLHLALSRERSARPSSVLAALEVEAVPRELVRTEIKVEQPQIALRAWRERGRFQ